MLTNVRALFGVATIAVLAVSLTSAAPLDSTSLNSRATGMSGSACLTVHTSSDVCTTGACGPSVATNGLPCVSIPAPIFVPLNPANPNNNPLCGKTVTLTKGGVSVKAVITDRNDANPAQNCGIGSPDSFDASPALFAALKGSNGNLEVVTYTIDG